MSDLDRIIDVLVQGVLIILLFLFYGVFVLFMVCLIIKVLEVII